MVSSLINFTITSTPQGINLAEWITAISTLAMTITAIFALKSWKDSIIYQHKLNFISKLIVIVELLNTLMSSKKFTSMDFEKTQKVYPDSLILLKKMIEDTLKEVLQAQKELNIEKHKIRILLKSEQLEKFDNLIDQINTYWHLIEEFLIDFPKLNTNSDFKDHVNEILKYKDISKKSIEGIKRILKEVK